MAEGFCAPKTNSFSFLASLLSGLPLSLAPPTHTCSLSLMVLQPVLLCEQSGHLGSSSVTHPNTSWCVWQWLDPQHTSCLQCADPSNNHLLFHPVLGGMEVGMAVIAPSWKTPEVDSHILLLFLNTYAQIHLNFFNISYVVVRMCKSLTSNSLPSRFSFSFFFLSSDGLSVLIKASGFPLTMTFSTWIKDYLPRSRLQSACL